MYFPVWKGRKLFFFEEGEEKNIGEWMKSVIQIKITSGETIHNEQFLLQMKAFFFLQNFF